jgi:hypothetical protein
MLLLGSGPSHRVIASLPAPKLFGRSPKGEANGRNGSMVLKRSRDHWRTVIPSFWRLRRRRGMMGRQTGDQSQLFYLFNLEDRIPERHLLRRINPIVTGVRTALPGTRNAGPLFSKADIIR